ncbi:hypothetical protein BV25DRAFT_1922309 [Artomyces pyxidatus]|uniref:Uncharacterized protein n=1 Tax=Artomyces pyxidatus TaxID=48021 RepID=A0ACB8SGN4_9AGAM|nr:hypothetical protein BV25DRAFT_1922309 [Artomyces pyxidatus]
MSSEPDEDSDEDSPAAFLVDFGKYAGQRLDTLDERYIDWCIHPDRKDNRWYADFVERVNNYRLWKEEHKSAHGAIEPPGDTKIWFGRHLGKRFSELDEGYKQWCLHPERRVYPWYDDFVKLNNDNERWKAEHETARSPGTIIVWFGKYKGHPFSDIFNRPAYMRALLNEKNVHCSWYPKLCDIVEQYKAWLKDNKKGYRPRRRTELIQHRGILLGSWDDGSFPFDADDEYDLDDGFVVADPTSSDGSLGSEEDEDYSVDFRDKDATATDTDETISHNGTSDAEKDVDGSDASDVVSDRFITPPRSQEEGLAMLKAARAKRKVGVRVASSSGRGENTGTDLSSDNLSSASDDEAETVSPPKPRKTGCLRVMDSPDTDDDVPFGELRARWRNRWISPAIPADPKGLRPETRVDVDRKGATKTAPRPRSAKNSLAQGAGGDDQGVNVDAGQFYLSTPTTKPGQSNVPVVPPYWHLKPFR